VVKRACLVIIVVLSLALVVLGRDVASRPSRASAPSTSIFNCASLADPAPAGGVQPRFPLPYEVMLVSGTSMVPALGDGYYIFVAPSVLSDVRLFDYIVFWSLGTLTVHQAIGAWQDEQGPFLFTRGVANCEMDLYPVRDYELVGVVVGAYWGRP